MLDVEASMVGDWSSMNVYYFQGKVLPERAIISFEFSTSFAHYVSGERARAKVSVVLNQVAVWVEAENEWNIFDLRNCVAYMLNMHFAARSFITGCAYDFEISRVINREREIDFVFGINVLMVPAVDEGNDLEGSIRKLLQKAIGAEGLFLNRCLADFLSALKDVNDAAFYCYRAVESLRHHCAALNGLSNESKGKQWEKFRESARCEESVLLSLKDAADPIRHGAVPDVKSQDQQHLLATTWKIIDTYTRNL
jgi:hypothetical protein